MSRRPDTDGRRDICAPGTPLSFVPPRSLTSQEVHRLNEAMWRITKREYDRRRWGQDVQPGSGSIQQI